MRGHSLHHGRALGALLSARAPRVASTVPRHFEHTLRPLGRVRWRMGSNGCLTAHILPSCFHLPHKTSLLSFRLTQASLVRAGDAATYNRLYAGHRCGKDGAAILGCYASTGSFLGKAFLASRQTSDATTVLQSIRLSTVLFDSGLVVCAAYSRTAKTLALSKQTGDCASRFK